MKDQVWSPAKKTRPKFLGLEIMTERHLETAASLRGLLLEGMMRRGSGNELPSPMSCRKLWGAAGRQLFSSCPRPHGAPPLEEESQLAVSLGDQRLEFQIWHWGKNECSVEIALSGKSSQTLNQGLSLALL